MYIIIIVRGLNWVCCNHASLCVVCRMTHSGADHDQEVRRRKISMMMNQVSGLSVLIPDTDRHCVWQTES